MPQNLPTLLTLMRIVLLPVLVAVFYTPVEWARPAAAALFIIGGITDWLDGYLARKWQQESRFGAFLDPVADKLMVMTALVLVVEAAASWVITVPAIVIVGREITISALREWMAEIGQRASVAVSIWGKLKTTCQIVALVVLLYESPLFGVDLWPLGVVLLYVAAILTIWSMIQYIQAAIRS
ncbi:MAG: CDP-diacylglycerol--glycerol-3-phosphate 3-phosphatidyltransferase [Pseudomonadota bacterium]